MTFTYKLSRRLAVIRLVPAVVLALTAACSGSDSIDRLGPQTPSDTPEPTVAQVVISPKQLVAAAGDTTQFAAYARSASGDSVVLSAVEWSASGGSITPGGVFTAADTGTYSLVAVDASRRRADTSTVTVVARPVAVSAIMVAPETATLAPGTTQAFTATAKLLNGSTQPAVVVWSATGGTIDAGGSYTAGTATGTYRVVATQKGGRLADTSVVTIQAAAPTLAAVVVSPKPATVAAGGTQQFTAGGKLSDGSSAGVSVTWAASGGTITSAGLYTAGGTAGSYRVIATQSGGTLADTSVVTVTAVAPPPPPSGGASYPNLPAGMTRIVEHGFPKLPLASSALVGTLTDPNSGNYSIRTGVTGTPTGSADVIETRWPKGLPGGSSPGHFDGWDNSNLYKTTKYRELYVSTRVKILGSDFENQLVGTKLWYVDYGNSEQQNDGYLMLENGTGAQAVQKSMKVAMYISPCDDRDGGSLPFRQNVDGRELFTVGQWHHVEVYMNAGTVDRKDGIVRVWIDGVKVIDRSDVQFLNSRYGFTNGFSWFQWTPVWGGNGGTRTRDDAMQMDHLLVAGKN